MAPRLIVLLATVLGLIWPAVAVASNQEPDGGVGASILIGGNFSPETASIYDSLIDAAGGRSARIGVIDVAASSVADGRVYVDDLHAIGVKHVRRVPIHGRDAADEARSPRLANLVRGLDGFMFSGGNQLRAVRALAPNGQPSRVLRALLAAHRQGAVVAGSSAGLHVQTSPMISGGESLEALRDGVASGFDEPGVRISRGFGTFDNGIADSHFDARGRIGRLLRAASARHQRWAFGVEEDTALVTDGEGAEVVGTGGVTVLDLAGADPTASEGPLRISGVGLSYLMAGDRIDLASGAVAVSAARVAFTPDPRFVGPPLRNRDALAPYAFRDLIARFATHGSAAESAVADGPGSGPGFRLSLIRGPSTRTYAESAGSGAGSLTLVGAELEVAPLSDR